MAEQQIDREREQAEDHDLGEQRHPELAGNQRHASARGERDQRHDDAVARTLSASLPKMPLARNSSRIAIGPNSTK